MDSKALNLGLQSKHILNPDACSFTLHWPCWKLFQLYLKSTGGTVDSLFTSYQVIKVMFSAFNQKLRKNSTMKLYCSPCELQGGSQQPNVACSHAWLSKRTSWAAIGNEWTRDWVGPSAITKMKKGYFRTETSLMLWHKHLVPHSQCLHSAISGAGISQRIWQGLRQ